MQGSYAVAEPTSDYALRANPTYKSSNPGGDRLRLSCGQANRTRKPIPRMPATARLQNPSGVSFFAAPHRHDDERVAAAIDSVMCVHTQKCE